MTPVNLNIDDLKSFMAHIIENNRYLQQNGKIPVAVEVVGDSGIGKTSTILQIAKEHNLEMVKLNLAQIEELGDLIGFPVRQFQMYKEKTLTPGSTEYINYMNSTRKSNELAKLDTPVTKKVGVWVDELAVSEYIKAGYKMTGKNRMSYAAPEWISDVKGGGVLLLDDWNRADMRFIQAVMELIDRQTYISWKLPKDWHIVLTSNPDNGDYSVNSLDSAQKTRYVSANLQFDIDVWAKWAESAEIDTRCINFLLMHPELVSQETNARSITTFFNCISSFKSFEDNLHLIQMIGEGSVGPEFASLFTIFINNKLDKLVSPKEFLEHKNEDYIFGELSSNIGKDDDYRADIAATISTRIANYTLHHATKNQVTSTIIDRLIRLITSDVLTDDLKYMVARTIYNGNKAKFNKLILNQDVVKYIIK